MSTIYAPSRIDVTQDDGTVYSLRRGVNLNVPDAVAAHWFVAAMGGEVVETKAEEADSYDSLRERAVAAGVKVDRRWGVDRLKSEIEAAEAPAPAPVPEVVETKVEEPVVEAPEAGEQ